MSWFQWKGYPIEDASWKDWDSIINSVLLFSYLKTLFENRYFVDTSFNYQFGATLSVWFVNFDELNFGLTPSRLLVSSHW